MQPHTQHLAWHISFPTWTLQAAVRSSLACLPVDGWLACTIDSCLTCYALLLEDSIAIDVALFFSLFDLLMVWSVAWHVAVPVDRVL